MMRILTICLLALASNLALAQTYNTFSPNGDLAPPPTSTNLSQTIAAGVVTNSKLANTSTNTVKCNYTGSTGSPQDCNPLAVANMLAAVVAVDVVAFSNISLSGAATIDGITVSNNQIVLAAQQTTSSQDGFYVVNTGGAWTRAPNFPAGYVINQNCVLSVFIEKGTSRGGYHYRLDTTAGSITIGTSAQTWALVPTPSATSIVAGITRVTETGGNPAALTNAAGTATQNDCVSYLDAAASLQDLNTFGLMGPCIYADSNGHATLVGNLVGPAVSGAGCTLEANSWDESGAIDVTGADTCTLTFGSTFTLTIPFCTVSGYSATVLPFISTAASATSVIFKSAAAGTFSYHCMT